jgi:membrane dipeptidase
MSIDPVLKPRIESIPPVSERALQLFRKNLVWDNCLPWLRDCNTPEADIILPRYHSAGVNFISLTVAASRFDDNAVTAQIALTNRIVREQSDFLVVANSTQDIRKAQSAGKLALGFNFQETLPFGTNLDNVQLFYDLGVRQAVLAYNNRNFVGDGCAEPDNGGLSLFGRALVKEMNRVGMLVDGSHSGHRTTMEAIDLCDGPFVFSHSNPFGVRPHYRSIKDDQIKACAATGGVIGINGVGYWVGDNDASTEAIFRCLDYTVELVGAKHVGLGFDYVYDLDGLIEWVRASPLVWPAFEGEWMVKHNYAGPEQMVELVQLMLDHGYPEEAIIGILGTNFERVANNVWK